MIIRNEKPLLAISYSTKTFEMLDRFLKDDDPTCIIERIEPEEFLNAPPNSNFQYINLITKDFCERKKVSEVLDLHSLDRFSYINQDLSVHRYTEFGEGCFIYPGAITYSAAIGKDCILHGRVSLAEDVALGQGCFLSGLVSIAGSTKIGNYCFISTNVTIMDKITITDNVHLLPSMTVKKSILEPGTYYNPSAFDVKKFRNISRQK